MLNRRGFFKAAAAASATAGVIAVTAEAKEAPAPVVEVEEERIPDGPVVGIGFGPLLATLEDEALAERVVMIYASTTEQSSIWMHYMRQEPDNWRPKMLEAQERIAALEAAGKFQTYIDNGLDDLYKYEWPAPQNGEWQAFPFVSRAEQEALDDLARA